MTSPADSPPTNVVPAVASHAAVTAAMPGHPWYTSHAMAYRTSPRHLATVSNCKISG